MSLTRFVSRKMPMNASDMKASHVSQAGSLVLPHGGERKNLNSELWHACAGPLVSLPAVGSHVVYFSQGHIEQVAASTQKADVETDDVYCQMTLRPVVGQHRESLFSPDIGSQSRQPNIFFCKTLTASDTSTHGGFSIPRRAAEKVFPPLDFTQQPPAQELRARDLHDMDWKFRHIYRGQPKRHLLTTGWSIFVSAKRLVAGDSVLFIRNGKGQLFLGIRRAARPQTVMPSSVLSSDSMHIGVLAAAAHAANTNNRFTVFYNPRTSHSEFVIPLSKFEKSVYHTRVSIGMRFRMLFETEESSVRRYMGTITDISDLDPVRWPNSQWRSIKVGWDESTAGDRQRRVSLWEIELLTTFLMYPPTANSRLRPSRPEPSGSLSSDMELESLKPPSMLMHFQNGSIGYNVLASQGTGITPLLDSLQQPSMVEPMVYDALGAAALQEFLSSKQLQLLPPDYLLYRAQAQQQQQMQYPVLPQYQQQVLPLQLQPLAQQQLQQQQLLQQLTRQQCLPQSQPQPQPQQLHSPHQQQPIDQAQQEQLLQHSHQQLLLHQQQAPQQQLLQRTNQQLLAQQQQLLYQMQQRQPQERQHRHLSHEPLQQQQQTHQTQQQPGQQLPLQQHHQQLPHQRPSMTLEQQQQELPQPPHQQHSCKQQQELPQPPHQQHSRKQQRLLESPEEQLHVPHVLSCGPQAHHHHQEQQQQEQKQRETQLHQQQTQQHFYPPLPQTSITESHIAPSVYSVFPGQHPKGNSILIWQSQQEVQTSQQQPAAHKQQQLHFYHDAQQSQPRLEHLHQQQPCSLLNVGSCSPRAPASQPQTVPSSLASPPHCTSTDSTSVPSSVTASQHPMQSIFGGFAPESYSMNLNLMSTARSLIQSAVISCSTEHHHDPAIPASWIAEMSQLVSGVPSELINDTRSTENTYNTGPVVWPSFQASEVPINLCNYIISSQDDSQSELQRQTLFGMKIDSQSMVVSTAMPLVCSATSDCSSGNDHQSQYMGHPNQGQSQLSEMDLPFSTIMFDGGLDDPRLVQPLAQANSAVRTYTKVYKTGSVGRSVDITWFSNYDELRSELARLFGLEGQLEDLQSGWQLIFVDKENDWLLLGDDPWEVFIGSVRYIKILSPSEVFQMQDGMQLLPVQQQASSCSEGCVTQQDTRNPSSVVTSLDY